MTAFFERTGAVTLRDFDLAVVKRTGAVQKNDPGGLACYGVVIPGVKGRLADDAVDVVVTPSRQKSPLWLPRIEIKRTGIAIDPSRRHQNAIAYRVPHPDAVEVEVDLGGGKTALGWSRYLYREAAEPRDLEYEVQFHCTPRFPRWIDTMQAWLMRRFRERFDIEVVDSLSATRMYPCVVGSWFTPGEDVGDVTEPTFMSTLSLTIHGELELTDEVAMGGPDDSVKIATQIEPRFEAK